MKSFWIAALAAQRCAASRLQRQPLLRRRLQARREARLR